jgi:hypothetical protein
MVLVYNLRPLFVVFGRVLHSIDPDRDVDGILIARNAKDLEGGNFSPLVQVCKLLPTIEVSKLDGLVYGPSEGASIHLNHAVHFAIP